MSDKNKSYASVQTSILKTCIFIVKYLWAETLIDQHGQSWLEIRTYICCRLVISKYVLFSKLSVFLCGTFFKLNTMSEVYIVKLTTDFFEMFVSMTM